jgi:hypothetical protein
VTPLDVRKATTDELVDRFAAVCVEQSKALDEDEIAKFNRLYDVMAKIRDELKARSGDQRNALLALFNHHNFQVQLQAARVTLAVAPAESRKPIEKIAASRWYPQAGDAGMTLANLDRGVFVPE